jgi:hypothetical protein
LNIAFTEELEKVARRLIWFKTPKEALKDPYTFLAHVMTYGTLEDILIIRKSLGINVFKEALDHIPPGIIDSKSWVYWNIVTGHSAVPPMPERNVKE